MSANHFNCPHCDAVLKTAVPLPAGKMVRCPKCSATFTVRGPRTPPLEIEADDGPATRPSAPRPPAPPPRERDDVPAADEAAPDRPRPARRRPAFDDYDDRSEDRPARRARPAPRKRSSGLLWLFVGLGAAGLCVLGCGGVVVYFAAFASREIPAAEWKPFTPPNGRCQVLMPGTPKPEPLPIDGLGVVAAQKHMVERKWEDAVFVVSYLDMNQVVLANTTFETLYVAERDNMLKTTNGRLGKETEISLAGYRGKEFQASVKGGGTIIMRMYLVPGPGRDRIYILMAGGSRMKPGKGDAAKFFDSFKLTGP